MSVETILEALAENAGRARLARGALIGNTVASVSQLPAQIMADQERQKNEAQRRALVNEDIQFKRAEAARADAQAQRQAGLDAKANTAQDAADLREKALKALIGAGFEKDPTAFDLAASVSKAKEIGAEDLIPTVMAVHEKMQGPKLMEADPTKNLVQPNTGKVVIPAAPKAAAPVTNEWEAYMRDTAPGLIGKTDWASMTPIERSKALSDFSALKADPAAKRQAETQSQQNRIQQNGQNFEMLKTARADIQKNADTPFQAAQSAADELRGLVKAAQSGNKIAASEQSLATAAATIRGFGLNRINMAEIGMPATAGSAADKVANFIGKWTDGQPVDPGLQKDMLQVADTLEAAARKKYEATHAGINKLYGTSIPQTFAAPASPSNGVKVLSITPVKP